MPKPTLRQQLLGALVGTAVALGAYGVYSVGAPVVQAFLTPASAAPADGASVFTDADRETRQEEIAAHARAILARLTRAPDEQ